MHMLYNFSSAIMKLVLSCLITRYIPLPLVFRQMEYIMTLTLEESEEISEEVLSSLLTSVSKTDEVWGSLIFFLCFCSLYSSYILSFCTTHVFQNVLSRSWRLGENVLRNCAAKVQLFLPKVVRSRNLSFNNYSIVVASICHNSPENEHVICVSSSTFTFLYFVKLGFKKLYAQCFFSINKLSARLILVKFL